MSARLRLRRPQLHEVEGLRFSPEAFMRVQGVGVMLYEQAYVLGRQDAAREIGKELQFAAIDAQTAAEWIAANAQELASGLLNDRMVKALQQALIDGIARDLPVEQIIGNALAALEGLLGDGTERQPTPPQVATAVRTILTSAYNEGRRAFFEDERLGGYVKGYMWSAVLDDRTTDFCRAMNGKKFAIDDPIWRTLGTPPAHFNALTAGTRITTQRGRVPIESVREDDYVLTHKGNWKRVYATMRKAGNSILRLQLNTGNVLCITKEHPVLCASVGWKLAGDLQVGDVLFENSQEMPRKANVPMVDPKHFPSLFDEPAIPFEVTRLSRRFFMALAIKLKQQAMLVEGKVGDVLADGLLENEGNTAAYQEQDKRTFMRRWFEAKCARLADDCAEFSSRIGHWVGVTHPVGMHFSPGVGFLAQAVSPMGFPARAVGIGLGIGDAHLFRSVAHGNAMHNAPTAENAISGLKLPLQCADGAVSFPMFLADQFRKLLFVCKQWIGWHKPPEWVGATIMSIAEEKYNGQVYNLAVEDDQSYHAEGLIVHNCRSLLVPITVNDTWRKSTYPKGVAPGAGFGTLP